MNDLTSKLAASNKKVKALVEALDEASVSCIQENLLGHHLVCEILRDAVKLRSRIIAAKLASETESITHD
jgi:hypothetical protein